LWGLGYGKFLLESVDPFALLLDAQVGRLVGFEKTIDQILAEFVDECRQNITGVFDLFIQRQTEAQAEFGIVLEQAIGPGRTTSFLIGGIRSGWQITAIN